MTTHDENDIGRIVLKLGRSSIYRTYQEAFLNATGLPLVLQPAIGEELRPCRGRTNLNKFCKFLNSGANPCAACVETQNQLAKGTEKRAGSISCFAGLRESAVPVRVGKTTVAFLKTGQVFHKKPSKTAFKSACKVLREQGRSKEEIEKLKKAYFESPVMEEQRYQGTMTLLVAFATQLAGMANRIMIEDAHQEPAVVMRAKQFIVANLEEPLSLDMVASHVGVSPYYFCKIFKQATNMTFTEYVNRRRVERAKRRLLTPDSRVTEVAFDVGYQSLSQFNRSFLKYVGESPTKYRERSRLENTALVA